MLLHLTRIRDLIGFLGRYFYEKLFPARRVQILIKAGNIFSKVYPPAKNKLNLLSLTFDI